MATMVLLLLVLILAMYGVSDGAWCVCKADASSAAQQKTIDYACGAGANCGPILQNGACYNPDTVLNHCSYAANSYYQTNNQDQQACNFENTAQIVTADPSSDGCTYPSSAAGAGGTPTTPTPAGAGGTSTTTTISPPGTPSSSITSGGGSIGGGGGLGLGPSIDGSGAASSLLPKAKMASTTMILIVFFFLLLVRF